jgi:hypothetical protein
MGKNISIILLDLLPWPGWSGKRDVFGLIEAYFGGIVELCFQKCNYLGYRVLAMG